MSLASFGSGLLGPTGVTRRDRTALAGRFDGGHILVPLLRLDDAAVADQVRVAAALGRATGASLSLVDPRTAPDGAATSLRNDASAVDDGALLEWARERTAGSPATGDGGLLRTREVIKAVLRTVDTRDVDLLVLPGCADGGAIRRSLTERIGPRASCDVLVVNGRAGYRDPPSILLPVAGGPHSGLAADFARGIAADGGAWVDVLHVVEGDASAGRRAAAEELVESVAGRLGRPETTSTWVVEADDVVDAVIEQSRYYGLTVMGAPTKGRLRRFLTGSTNRSVRANARSVVLSARNNRQPVMGSAGRGTAPSADR